MQIKPVKCPIFNRGEDLTQFVKSAVPSANEGTILLVTSKIVALGQGDVVGGASVANKRELIKQEADRVLFENKLTAMTITHGVLIAAAGIDESNADGVYILLPKNPFRAAKKLWAELRAAYQLKNLGVIFTDSRSTPLRRGLTGVAIAHWGFKPIRSHIGKTDLFGRPLVMSQSNIADSLASAGVLLMGESNEATPIAVATECGPIEFCEENSRDELVMNEAEDIFSDFFVRR